MKKLTALVLTLTMLLSMLVLPMGVTATEMTEAERQEILSAPYYQYVDLSSSANADLFASFEEAGTYARFNKSAAVQAQLKTRHTLLQKRLRENQKKLLFTIGYQSAQILHILM